MEGQTVELGGEKSLLPESAESRTIRSLIEKPSRLLRAAFVLLLLLLPHSLVSNEGVFAPASSVSFTLRAEHSNYKAGEPVVVNYKIRNITSRPLFVPQEWSAQCPPKPHIFVWLRDPSGKKLASGYGGDCFPSSQPKTVAERMRREATLLKSMQSYEGRVVVNTSLFGPLMPGPYRVEAFLSGWELEEFDKSQRSELVAMAHPFVSCKTTALTRVTITF